MRKRTSKRRRFTWLNNLGAAGILETSNPWPLVAGQLTVDPSGDDVTIIAPMVLDFPQEGTELTQTSSLADQIGSEYVIERIVGNLYASVTAPGDDEPTVINPKVVIVTAGIFIARANDADSGGGANTPIGSASALERFNNYSPMSPDTTREPWMFRRTWILASGRESNAFALRPTPFAGLGGFGKQNNTDMDGGVTGPFVDVRSVRRVRNDERLFLAISGRSIDRLVDSENPPNPGGTQTRVNVVFDYRVLGAIRRAANRSNF